MIIPTLRKTSLGKKMKFQEVRSFASGHTGGGKDSFPISEIPKPRLKSPLFTVLLVY